MMSHEPTCNFEIPGMSFCDRWPQRLLREGERVTKFGAALLILQSLSLVSRYLYTSVSSYFTILSQRFS